MTDQQEAFASIVRGRRSWLGYTGALVDPAVLSDLVGLAGLAPSETNLQPWHFAVVQGDTLERLVPAFIAPNQPKVVDAANVVIVFGDPDKVEDDPRAVAFYGLGFTTRRDFAVRNASLAAMTFMLAAEASGLVTRPMVGYDPALVVKTLAVPEGWVPVVAMLVGHPGNPQMPDTDRQPVDEILTFYQ